ncbi:cutinase family protein [Streptomyces sp. NBC_01751]|uniref:cutinase family protein n=1 Tax=Streptomyces sp. NBC_01751 TaxID=2975929 RepID=UPI002DDB6AC3|nr:cutinase family protein [Streptomyces sp. NBC_01751]WSD22100.1 cutinase family protein [Streptomyces sp. NBC_01751]WSD29876.1 cutinase family protein [Streptomyces sp. NBC_01751]
MALGKLTTYLVVTSLFFGLTVLQPPTTDAHFGSPSQTIECKDIFFFGAHGVGEEGFGPEVEDVWTKYKQGMSSSGLTLDAAPIDYPKQALPQVLKPRTVSNLEAVTNGAITLNAQLSERRAKCGNERYVLVGYSQGAWVIDKFLALAGPSVLDWIAGVALLGDPQYPKTGIVRKLAPSYAISPYLPPSIKERANSWCVSYDFPDAGRSVADPVCQLRDWRDIDACLKVNDGKIPREWCPHFRYKETGGTERAADFLVNITKAEPAFRYEGTWRGAVKQGESKTYPAKVNYKGGTVGETVATVEYPTLECSGRWVLISQTDQGIEVEEQTTEGDCPDVTITLTQSADGTLQYAFDFPERCRATLRRD